MIDDTELKKLRYEEMRINNAIRGLELTIKQAWKEFMLSQSAKYRELGILEREFLVVQRVIRERGARPDDHFPSELLNDD